jgi:chromosome segregation ATPase
MSGVRWTPELEAELLRLKSEKKSNAEIAYAMGLNISQVKNRLVYIKTRKPSPLSSLPEGEAEVSKLNDLEAAMAETIEELTSEKAALVETLQTYEKDYGELLAKNENCLSKIAEQAQTIEQLQHELNDMKEALAHTEEQLDEERRESASHLDKVREQIKTISDLEARAFGAESDQLAKDLEIGKLKDRLDDRDAEIEDLTSRLERAAEKAGQLLTQCLMMGE